jgi:hypothetical protein
LIRPRPSGTGEGAAPCHGPLLSTTTLDGLQHEIDELVDLSVAAVIPDNPCAAVVASGVVRVGGDHIEAAFQPDLHHDAVDRPRHVRWGLLAQLPQIGPRLQIDARFEFLQVDDLLQVLDRGVVVPVAQCLVSSRRARPR